MPRQVNHDERRREIIHSVWHLIATTGFESVTFRQVAADAGISLGQVQHYFADKHDLVRSGCEEVLRLAAAHFDAESGSKAPLDQLRDLLHQPIPTTPEFRAGSVVWSAYRTKSLDDPEIARLIRGAEEGRRALAKELLDQLGGTTSGHAARRLLALADGLATHVLVGLISPGEAMALLDAEIGALPSQGPAPVG